MKTNPLYLEDPYLTEMDAEIIDVIPEKEGVIRLILDQTVFYPMGGGQSTDQGTLKFDNGAKGEVYQVLMKDGEINHYVKVDFQPQKGKRIRGTINWDRRYKNMKLHSAGHIVDFSVFLLGYSPNPLLPIKGDHGKKPFVLYSGVIKCLVKEKIQEKVDDLIRGNFKFSWNFEPLEVLEKEAIYLQPGLPMNKPLRALRLEGVGAVADGGTIVASTGEVGGVAIFSVECNDRETKIRYSLTG
ncbi:MAG: alanyl-tRNA editing protein [Waddliaceae bacterium]